MGEAWLNVSLAVACERLGRTRQAKAHAGAAIRALQAHGGREPRVSLLKARLAAVQGRETTVFEELRAALASGWVDAGALDNDPVFGNYRARVEFAELRAKLQRRQSQMRLRLAEPAGDLKLAVAGSAFQRHP